MTNEKAIEILKKTDKLILYKKRRYGRKIPVNNKEEAVELYLKCEDGAIMVYEDCVEIWDYNEIDWLS